MCRRRYSVIKNVAHSTLSNGRLQIVVFFKNIFHHRKLKQSHTTVIPRRVSYKNKNGRSCKGVTPFSTAKKQSTLMACSFVQKIQFYRGQAIVVNDTTGQKPNNFAKRLGPFGRLQALRTPVHPAAVPVSNSAAVYKQSSVRFQFYRNA